MDEEENMASGGALAPSEAARLEARLVEEPNDWQSRLRLLRYHRSASSAEHRERWREHALWVIKNHPESEMAGSPDLDLLDPVLDPEGYIYARAIWIRHANEHPTNRRIVENAIAFFTSRDTYTAESLLKRAQMLEPDNSQWRWSLAHLYMLRGIRQPESRAALAAAALGIYEEVEPSGEDAIHRAVWLERVLQASCEAGNYARADAAGIELLELSQRLHGSWEFGNAVHHSHIGLGLVALHRGDLEKAEDHLLRAGRVSGSPQLDSFGPNLRLARALAERGHLSVVIEYLDFCSSFWRTGQSKLRRWKKELAAGSTPDFGVNA